MVQVVNFNLGETMSTVNDTKSMTSVQVKRRLKSIDTDKHEIKSSLLKVVEQFQCLDHIARSIGLVKEGFSFAKRVSWQPVLSMLNMAEDDENVKEATNLQYISETFSTSSDQLENELVPQLQKWRNDWMLQVVLIEFVFLGLLSLAIAGVTHIQGLWSFANISISFQPLFYERPVFSLITGVLLFISFAWIHFSIRNFVAEQFVMKLNENNSEFDLAAAFLKNTRIQHSIFRPDIIGWGWLNRKCLQKASENK